MSRDGGLRQLFSERLREVHWVPIESWGTGVGIPDMNGCFGGIEFWIENKLTTTSAVSISPGQVAWHERRSRSGGRTFIAIRMKASAGKRKGPARDELHLYRGISARSLLLSGLKSNSQPVGVWKGGPARWDWEAISSVLLST